MRLTKWKFEYETATIRDEETNEYIASTRLVPYEFGSPTSIAEHEADANARLISKAPELLSAVKSMLLYIETYGGDVTANFAGTNGENIRFYKELISKAEGVNNGSK